MGAQVLGRDAEVDMLAGFSSIAVARGWTGQSADGEARSRLVGEIAAARRRIVSARAELASAADPELHYLRSAQRVLAAEQRETDRVVQTIASDAEIEIARTLGYAVAPDRSVPHSTGDESRLGAVEVAWLQSHLARLGAKADLLEGQIPVAAAKPSAVAPGDLALLAGMLTNALAVTREDHRRQRDRAWQGAEQRLAAARDEAESRRYAGAPRAEAWSPPAESLTTDSTPLAGSPPSRAEAPSTALVLRPPADGRDRADAGPPVWRSDAAEPATRAKPMVLDVVLPLIAVAIVLLVVLSWIG
jgi:hypothetical protein